MNAVCGIRVLVEVVLLLLSPIEELDSNLLEQSEGEKVLVLLLIGSNPLTEGVDLGSDLVSGTVINDLVVADDLLLEVLVDLRGAREP